MAKKKELVRNQDQFLVRLPEGMQDRIKATPERAGMSMNEAIVWCLDLHFPAPATLEQKVHELAEMVALLKRGSGLEQEIDGIIGELDSVLRDVASDKIKGGGEKFSSMVAERIYEWDMDEAEQASDPFDDDNWSTDVGGMPGTTGNPDWDPFEPEPKPKKD